MTRRRAEGMEVQTLVEIGVPFEHPGQDGNREGPWCCQVKTEGLGDDRCYTLFGTDSIQALTCALVFAETITTSSRYSRELDWAHVPNHGFPIIAEMHLGAQNPKAKP